jgi:hypothetical protein
LYSQVDEIKKDEIYWSYSIYGGEIKCRKIKAQKHSSNLSIMENVMKKRTGLKWLMTGTKSRLF